MVVPAVSIAAAIVLAVAVAVVVVVTATVSMSGVGGAGIGGAGVGGADSAGLRQAGVVRRWRLCVPCSAATHAATWWLAIWRGTQECRPSARETPCADLL